MSGGREGLTGVPRRLWHQNLSFLRDRRLHRMLELAQKMETEMAESWYTGFYHQLRAEMDEYYRAKRRLRLVKENTDYEEDLYDEAV